MSVKSLIMNLYEKVKLDNNAALKAGDKVTKSILTVILGDVTTQAKRENTEVTDEICLTIIRKIVKSIEQTIALTLNTSSVQELQLKVLNSYLPKSLSKEEIIKLIEDNNLTNQKEAFAYLNINYKKLYDSKIIIEFFKDKQ